MTRSHKFNDRPHGALAEAYLPEDRLPKFFAKNGFADTDPKKTKKNGCGKGNWGSMGEEIVDEDGFHFANAHRRSNSSSMTTDIRNFKTKFDVNEPEPVFEEDLHGPLEEDEDDLRATDSNSTVSEDAKST